MSKQAEALKKVLAEKGIEVTDVFYSPGFSWLPTTGWYGYGVYDCEYCTRTEYYLGKDFEVAQKNIQDGVIKQSD